jgi:zinc protease
MKNSAFFILTFILISCTTDPSLKTLTSTEDGYTYEHVMGDPMKTRIYTLNNGLKVYMSQYKNEPRIQIDIAVKAGGKNDPASHTGLAHYLEHIMFKGTDVFGSLNFKEEAPKLDSIEAMFNYYSTITDSLERVNYYKLIDQFSNDAAKLAIPNEYNKMIAEIGGQGTNAYTTEDRTVYITDVPANELSKFLKIQGARFNKIVPRLFHTELEAVYEEKNRSLDNDYWKVSDALKSSKKTINH